MDDSKIAEGEIMQGQAFLDLLHTLYACEEATDWVSANIHQDLKWLWENCTRSDWMLWLLWELDDGEHDRYLEFARECAQAAVPIWEQHASEEDKSLARDLMATGKTARGTSAWSAWLEYRAQQGGTYGELSDFPVHIHALRAVLQIAPTRMYPQADSVVGSAEFAGVPCSDMLRARFPFSVLYNEMQGYLVRQREEDDYAYSG